MAQFVLLPRSGVRASTDAESAAMLSLPRVASTAPPAPGILAAAPGAPPLMVIDTLQENGAKLVEMSPAAAQAANSGPSPVRAVPIVTYGLPVARPSLQALPAPGVAVQFKVRCKDAATGQTLQNCEVVAFEQFAARRGDSGQSDANGEVTLRLMQGSIERLYVFSSDSHWGAFRRDLAVAAGDIVDIPVEPIDLNYRDSVRTLYGSSRFDPGAGVTVGVIDTGVGPHPDLNIVSGCNTVTGEPAGLFQDRYGHGTHVAGLIGSRGTPPTGVRGMAPGAAIRAYAVFSGPQPRTTNYAILKALIIASTVERCDIVNLSLGGGPYDAVVEEAIADARNQGVLVTISAGNDNRSAVSYPAAYRGATAVSAFGLEGSFPAGSAFDADVERPPTSGVHPSEFIAAFSNIGPEVAVTAPGVGVLSTMPHGGHAPMSGTSMASPVAAGAAACLLSRDPAIRAMPRDRYRSDAIERLLQSHCVRRGFGSTYEGYGLPDPAAI